MATKVIIRRTSVSDGARALKDSLNTALVPTKLSDKSTYTRPYLIVNWGGTSAVGGVGVGTKVLNNPEVVSVARNKLATFTKLREAGFTNLPDFWTIPPTDEQRGKSIILQRTVDGQSGSGIKIKRPGEALTAAPMYVRYVPKLQELRIHVMNGKAIAVQQKRKVDGREQSDDEALIRSHHNGWIFAVNDINHEAAEAAKPVAIEACRILGMDFGAVDIIIPKSKTPKPPVFLEVNTRPGLESPTVLGAYTNELKSMAGEIPAAKPITTRRTANAVTKRRSITTHASNTKRNHAGLADVQGRYAGKER
jgi:Glutathione synthase/Ribosomal protein S6 modification enzyme (glutaminyl transferase)